jgi:hypothetical protein
MAMRAFQITAEFQELYKYPELTDQVKAAVFGLNAARLFNIDPAATRCGLATDPLTSNIQESAQLRNVGALPSAWSSHGPTTRRQVLNWLASPTTRWIPT